MTENIGAVGAPFNSVIPSLSDNADIQAALRYYHYGADTNDPGALAGDGTEDFIAGHLQTLENTKLGQDPTDLVASANLNDYTTTGFYVQANTPSGSDYPAAYAGVLTVISDGTNVFQQYQVVGVAESGSASSTNKTWWRFYYGGSWKVWRTFVTSGEFTTLGDARYYTQTLANSTFLSQASATANYLTIAAADARQYVSENVQTGDYTMALTDVSKVIAMNSTSTTTLTIPLNSSVAFPTGTIINVYAVGTGEVRVAPAVGVTLRPFGTSTIKLYDQYTEISLRKRDTNEWVASGNFLEV